MERLTINPVATLILLTSVVASLLCVVRVWRKPGALLGRLFWSAFVFVPVLGPLMFFTLYRPPEPSEFAVRNWRSESGEGRH